MSLIPFHIPLQAVTRLDFILEDWLMGCSRKKQTNRGGGGVVEMEIPGVWDIKEIACGVSKG